MSGAGRLCEKHGEWCPTGECRWCAPVAEGGLDKFTLPVPAAIPQHDGGYLLPPEVAKHFREGVTDGSVGRPMLTFLDFALASVRPVKASPVVDCFCGRWHFSDVFSPLRDKDGAVHTPEACGRFTPAATEVEEDWRDIMREPGDPEPLHEGSITVSPAQAGAIRALAAADAAPLVPCFCRAFTFQPAHNPPGTPMRWEAGATYHSPEACHVEQP